jgi:hypothetical protein
MKRGITFALIFALVLLPLVKSAAIPQGSPLIHSQPLSKKLNGSVSKKRSFGNNCDGRTDLPHVSTHFPNTVNVTAITECPNQEVYITTSISRHGWWIFPETKSISKKGFQKVIVNLALKCKWKIGDPPILYVVKSSHRDAAGASAPTGRSEKLKC